VPCEKTQFEPCGIGGTKLNRLQIDFLGLIDGTITASLQGSRRMAMSIQDKGKVRVHRAKPADFFLQLGAMIPRNQKS